MEFGKGNLASLDFLFILCILLIGASVGVVLYRSTLRVWLQKSRFPFTLRLLAGGLTVMIIAITLYWFLYYVLNTQPDLGALMLPTAIIVLGFAIYFAVVWFTAKRPRVN